MRSRTLIRALRKSMRGSGKDDLRIQRVLKTPVNWYNWKEQADLARAISRKVKLARYNDDNDDHDDDDDRNTYLRNEYL